MQPYPLQTASSDGQYNYHQHRHYQHQHQHQHQNQHHACKKPLADPRERTAHSHIYSYSYSHSHSTQAARKCRHRQQRCHIPPSQKQQHRVQDRKHKHHLCACRLLNLNSHNPTEQPSRTLRSHHARNTEDKNAALRYWLSEYIDAGEIQGSNIVNLDEPHISSMDESFPPTPASPKSMALSPSQSPNGLPAESHPASVEDMHNKSSQQTGIKREADQRDAFTLTATSRWALVPFDAPHDPLLALQSLRQRPSSYHHYHPSQFAALGSVYHHHHNNNMQLGDNTIVQQRQQQQQQHRSAVTPMSPLTSFTSLSTASRERHDVLLQSKTEALNHPSAVRYAPNGCELSRSASTPTLFTASEGAGSDSQGHALLELPFVHSSDTSLYPFQAELSLQRTLSAQSAFSGSSLVSVASLASSRSTQHPLYAPSMIPAAFCSTPRHAAVETLPLSPPDYGLVGHVPAHPAATMQYTYGQQQQQRVGVKRAASSCSDHHRPSPKQRKALVVAAAAAVKEELEPRHDDPRGGSGGGSSSSADAVFDFDDYIDLSPPKRNIEAGASSSGLQQTHFGSPYDAQIQQQQVVSNELMSMLGLLATDAAATAARNNTALPMAVTPPPYNNFEHDGTVSPEDLFIHPHGVDVDAPFGIKRETDEDREAYLDADSTISEPSLFAALDPLLIGAAGNDHDSGGHDEQRQQQHHHHHHTARTHRGEEAHDDRHSGLPSYYQQPNTNTWLDSDAYGPLGLRVHGSPPETMNTDTDRTAARPAVTPAEAYLIRLRTAEEQRAADCERRRKDHLLLRLKREGYTYREIREKGEFVEAESTLRGRYRTLTKTKQERVRKPTWTQTDDRLLVEAVAFMARGRPVGQFKVAWKAVAERIVDNGGSYRFGNTTCRKRYDWLVEQGMARSTSHDTDDDGDDDAPSTIYFDDDHYADLCKKDV